MSKDKLCPSLTFILTASIHACMHVQYSSVSVFVSLVVDKLGSGSHKSSSMLRLSTPPTSVRPLCACTCGETNYGRQQRAFWPVQHRSPKALLVHVDHIVPSLQVPSA